MSEERGGGRMTLLLVGAGARLAVAALVSALLWIGFVWATGGAGAS